MDIKDHFNRLHTFHSSDGKMKFVDEGKGDAIVFVHGIPTSSWIYRSIISILVNKGFRVIAPDMLGFGYSDKPDGYDVYSAANQGRRLRELVEHLKLESWTQVFHDGGGLWTWELLKSGNPGISALVSLNSIFYEEGFHPPLRFQQGYIAKLFASLYKSKIGQMMVLNSTFKNGLSKSRSLSKEELLGYQLPLRTDDGDRGLYYFFTQTCHQIPDYSSLHKSLDIPVCVIWGKNDVMLRWNDISSRVKSNFKVSEKDVHILDANHFIQEEKPEDISDIIGDFVKSSNFH